MALSDDTIRLLRDNLKGAYAKVAAITAFLLGWLAPYKAAEYLGVESRAYRWLIVLAFYIITIVATVIVFLYRSLHQAYEQLGPGVPTQKALAELAAKFIGVEKELMADECQMLPDGSSVSVNDVKVRAHTNRVTRIEQTSSTPSVPLEINQTLEVRADPRQEGGIKIASEVLRSTPQLCVWSINFSPELRNGNSVHFRYRINTPTQSFARTHEEMKARNLDDEHYSHQVSYPTAQLQVKVLFHAEITPVSISYDVWLGKGGLRHMDEYIRVSQRNCFSTAFDEDGRLYGKLDVPYPVYGLRYVITWRPQKQRAAN